MQTNCKYICSSWRQFLVPVRYVQGRHQILHLAGLLQFPLCCISPASDHTPSAYLHLSYLCSAFISARGNTCLNHQLANAWAYAASILKIHTNKTDDSIMISHMIVPCHRWHNRRHSSRCLPFTCHLIMHGPTPIPTLVPEVFQVLAPCYMLGRHMLWQETRGCFIWRGDALVWRGWYGYLCN